MDDKQIRILTLCQNCNTLVADINGHAKSGVCDSEAYQASDDSQNSISNRVFLSADDLSKINFSPKVLDDLGGNRLNHSGTSNHNYKFIVNNSFNRVNCFYHFKRLFYHFRHQR